MSQMTDMSECTFDLMWESFEIMDGEAFDIEMVDENTNEDCIEESPVPTHNQQPSSTDPTDPISTDPTDPSSTYLINPISTDPSSTDPTDPSSTDLINPISTDLINPSSTDLINPISTDLINPSSTDPSSTDLINPSSTDPISTDLINPSSTDQSNPISTDLVNPSSTDPSNPSSTDPSNPTHNDSCSSIASSTAPSRFKKLTNNDLEVIEGDVYSKSTKKNTKWGINVFNAWCFETMKKTVDLTSISPDELNGHLRKFYAEAAPRQETVARRKESEIMTEDQASEYHKSSLKNVRAAINRYLKEKRDIDIVKDKQFETANKMLSGKLKSNLRQGLSRPVKHYAVIESVDLDLINKYLQQENSPIALRFKVWFCLGFHFVSRGVEFHHQLKINSLEFSSDECGREYIKLAHETLQKNHQGGVSQKCDETADKRMYSTGGPACPVQAVKVLISKTDPSCTMLFNQCSTDALKNPSFVKIWYLPKPVKAKQYSQFMPDICKNSGSKRYTAHSIRATAIQGMDDAGFEARSITFMSDHKREESIKSYARQLSTGRKQNISDTLAKIYDKHTPTSTVTSTAVSDVVVYPQPSSIPVALPHPPSIDMEISNVRSNSGFAHNSTFHNCTFNVSGQI